MGSIRLERELPTAAGGPPFLGHQGRVFGAELGLLATNPWRQWLEPERERSAGEQPVEAGEGGVGPAGKLELGGLVAATGAESHCVSVGFQGLEHEIAIDQGHLLLGPRLSAVIEGEADPQAFIPQLIELYREGKFAFDRLVMTFPFAEINAAIEASESGEVIKPILVFDYVESKFVHIDMTNDRSRRAYAAVVSAPAE